MLSFLLREKTLNKKDFDKNYTSDNSYTRNKLSKLDKVNCIFYTINIFSHLIEKHKFQKEEVLAIANSYIHNHISDNSDGNYKFIETFVSLLSVPEVDFKRNKFELKKEWYVGDYSKLLGQISDFLNDYGLNATQIKLYYSIIMEKYFSNGEDV